MALILNNDKSDVKFLCCHPKPDDTICNRSAGSTSNRVLCKTHMNQYDEVQNVYIRESTKPERDPQVVIMDADVPNMRVYAMIVWKKLELEKLRSGDPVWLSNNYYQWRARAAEEIKAEIDNEKTRRMMSQQMTYNHIQTRFTKYKGGKDHRLKNKLIIAPVICDDTDSSDEENALSTFCGRG